MKASFLKALPVILVYEGGYSNHPRDPGGVTLEGVIQRVYNGYRQNKGLAAQALIRGMLGTAAWNAERNEIYKRQYWDAIRGDELPAGIDLVMFDCAVNSGPYQAAIWLQRALRMPDIDGHIGEGTLLAAMSHPDHDKLIADILSRRLGMLKHLKTWADFGKGWAARVANLLKIGQAWASGSVGPRPVAVCEAGGHCKAYASDVAQPLVSDDVGKGAAAGGAGVAATVQVGKESLLPLVGTSDFITRIYVGLTVLAIVIAAGGAVYTYWAGRKNKIGQRAINGELTAPIGEAVAAADPEPEAA